MIEQLQVRHIKRKSVCPHCRATSILASTEDARLDALCSLTAAVAVAYRGSGPPAGLPLVSASVDALSRVLLPVLEHAARGQGDAPGVAFSWLCASMAAAAEISQVSALCVLSKCNHPWNDLLDLTDGTGHRSWVLAQRQHCNCRRDLSGECPERAQ